METIKTRNEIKLFKKLMDKALKESPLYYRLMKNKNRGEWISKLPADQRDLLKRLISNDLNIFKL
jgi:hypothetical protein